MTPPANRHPITSTTTKPTTRLHPGMGPDCGTRLVSDTSVLARLPP